MRFRHVTAAFAGFGSRPDGGVEPSHFVAACLSIAIAGIAAYANSLHAPFVFDGIGLLEQVEREASQPSWFLAVRPRAVGFFTFAAQYRLHGLWLPGFHAVNIAVHVASGLLLFGATWIACRLDRWPNSLRGDALPIATGAAVLFVLHPIQTQAVTYLYQRYESLMAMFFLAAVFCFAMATRDPGATPRRQRGWLVAAALSVLLSIGTKEVGAMAPLVLLWYDRGFISSDWKTLLASRGWFHLPLLALLVAGGLVVFINRDHYASGGILDTTRMPVLVYAMHQPLVICRYLGVVCWPARLCLDWNLRPTADHLHLLPPLLAISCAVALTVWAARRLPAVGFLLGSFFLILAPTSSFAPIIDLAFEHRMYLPLAPLAVLAVLGGRSVWLRLQLPRLPGYLAFAAVAVVLGLLTHQRNSIYATGVRIWVDVIEANPLNPRAFYNLAYHVEREVGDEAMAIRLYRRSLALNPYAGWTHCRLAELLTDSDPRQAEFHRREAERLGFQR